MSLCSHTYAPKIIVIDKKAYQTFFIFFINRYTTVSLTYICNVQLCFKMKRNFTNACVQLCNYISTLIQMQCAIMLKNKMQLYQRLCAIMQQILDKCH